MNRKFFLFLSRVFRFFTAHLDTQAHATFIQHPCKSTCEKEKTQLTAHCSLFTIYYSLLITRNVQVTTYSSLLTTLHLLLTVHYWFLVMTTDYWPSLIRFSALTTPVFSTHNSTIHHSFFNKQLTTHHSLHILYYSPLITHYPLYELLITQKLTLIFTARYLLLTINNSPFTTHNSLLNTHNALFTTNPPTHYSLPTRTTCFLFDQQVHQHQHVTWWIASFSFSCRVCFVSSLFCLISISQTHAIFIQHLSNQRLKKKLTTHPTASYSLFSTCNFLFNTK